jgi:excinuclease ABC subunit C
MQPDRRKTESPPAPEARTGAKSPPEPPPSWHARLEQKLKLVPRRPGVYIMRDGGGRILYIGKAKLLPARVRSYFRGEAPDARLQALRERIRDFDYVVTATEAEALVLEANLVKAHAPKFNVELKDDKKYPFLRVDVTHEFPRLEVTRNVRADGARYYGPYTRVKDMRHMLRSLRRLFPLRSCGDRRLERGGRECLFFFIDMCRAPCTGRIDAGAYAAIVEGLGAFLEGRGGDVVGEWEERMRALAAELRFEESAQLRDDIAWLEQLRDPQRMTDLQRPDLDVVALAARGNHALAAVFSHREGKVVGTWRIEVGRAAEAGAGEIMASVLARHYQARAQVPPLVLCDPLPADREVLEGWLTSRAGRRVRVTRAVRGEKARLARAARENAELALEEAELMAAGRERRLKSSAYALQEALGLAQPPVRIEGYDISTLQGRQAVGAQVVFRDGSPYKGGYRRYRIRTVAGQDDFAMLGEVLVRRARHFDDPGDGAPDLILIDGGRGQVNRAAEVLRDAGRAGIPLIGLAKREEEIFRPGEEVPLRLPRSSPALQLLQRVRDEAHRFAVGYHREVRSRALVRDPLAGVTGLGARRRQALLDRFGSLGALARASLEEMTEVPGIGPGLAGRVQDALRQGPQGRTRAQRSKRD